MIHPIKKVSIKIEQGTYSSFRHLSNKAWYVFAEYVDNAWSSKIENEKELLRVHKDKYQFTIKIDIDRDTDTIKIWDNAGGINNSKFENAFKLGQIPLDITGLNEFGMGMKTSSIWLADLWSIKSAAIIESVERSIEFDLKKVVDKGLGDLNVINKAKNPNVHFTEIILTKLSRNAPNSYQLSKIKDHLASIYRIPISSGEMKLIINNDILTFENLNLLNAPYIKLPQGRAKEWRKDIKITDGKYKVEGYIGILNKLSNSLSGISLFRRGRVISGTFDEKYKPRQLFGNDTGSYRYKRLYGELHLEGFNVSHNKGSFQELDELDSIMNNLKKELANPKENYFLQVEYVSPKTKEDDTETANKIVKKLNEQQKKTPLKEKFKRSLKEINNTSQNKKNQDLVKNAVSISTPPMEEMIEFKNKKYNLQLQFISDANIDSLYSLFEIQNKDGSTKILYKINLNHPFLTKYADIFKKDKYEPIIDLIRALVLAEITAPSNGTKNGDVIRDNFNHCLKNII